MSTLNDHGLEVLRKSGELVSPPDKSNTYIKVGGDPLVLLPPVPVTSSFTVANSLKAFYNEVSAVAASVSTLIHSYTVPVDSIVSLQRIELSGTNIAEYVIKLDSDIIIKKRTYFPEFNTYCEFGSHANAGLNLSEGQIVEIYVLHERPDVGDFNATIEVVEA